MENKYGFKEFPEDMSLRKVEKIFDHALDRKKDSVLREIILKFPQYQEGKGYSFLNRIANNYPEFLEAVFQLGLHPDKEGSFLCLVFESPELIKLGIKYGADLERTNWDNEVALGYATHYGCFESVKVLVEAGANVNAIEGKEHNCTPLDCAWEYPEIQEYLIEHGAKKYEEL